MSEDDEPYGGRFVLDFGSGVTGKIIVNSADEEVGLMERHPGRDGAMCFGYVPWHRGPGEPGPCWNLVSREPLTLSPSILCRICEHHGYIRDGKWVDA